MRIFTWQMAEELAEGHMRELGFEDSRRTAVGADDGVDVMSRQAIAQVKRQSKPVGSPEMQRLRGAAFHADHALFYSSSGYTDAARTFADLRSVALFVYDTSGNVKAGNQSARALEGTSQDRNVTPGRQKQTMLKQIGALYLASGVMYKHAARYLRTELDYLEGETGTISDVSSDTEIRAVTARLRPRAAAMEQFRLRRGELAAQFEVVQGKMLKDIALGTSVPVEDLCETLEALEAHHANWPALLDLDQSAISDLVDDLT